jgi:hypothetical protein
MLVPSKRASLVGNSVGLVLNLLIVGGMVIAVLGPTWGIILTVGGVVAYFLLNLVVGVVGYRSVMRRPWPRVKPLEDDDDDW